MASGVEGRTESKGESKTGLASGRLSAGDRRAADLERLVASRLLSRATRSVFRTRKRPCQCLFTVSQWLRSFLSAGPLHLRRMRLGSQFSVCTPVFSPVL